MFYCELECGNHYRQRCFCRRYRERKRFGLLRKQQRRADIIGSNRERDPVAVLHEWWKYLDGYCKYDDHTDLYQPDPDKAIPGGGPERKLYFG
jgi:hypothetical protein